jgi:hypothetical protein
MNVDMCVNCGEPIGLEPVCTRCGAVQHPQPEDDEPLVPLDMEDDS